MAIDRSKFRATPIDNLETQTKNATSLIGSASGRAETLKIDEGFNKFRIYPANEGEKSFMYLQSIVFLPQEIEIDKNGKKTIEIKQKPLFNSRVHGNTAKDIVEEYVKFSLTKITENAVDVTEVNKKSALINGFKTSDGKFNSGLKYQNRWVCYADKYSSVGKEFGLLPVTPGVKEKINRLAATESTDEPIATDPFTDAEEGVCLIIERNSKEKDLNLYYTLSLEEKKEGKLSRRLVPTPLTDSDLENFLKFPSLGKKYVNSYKRSDFENALNGLKIFDEQNKIGTFVYDTWFDIVDEISEYYVNGNTDVESEVEKMIESEESCNNVNESNDDNDGGDMFDDMDRDDLKIYIKENRLPITIKQDYTDDKIRKIIRMTEEEINSTETSEPQTKETESFPPKDVNTNVSMSSIRQKFGKK